MTSHSDALDVDANASLQDVGRIQHSSSTRAAPPPSDEMVAPDRGTERHLGNDAGGPGVERGLALKHHRAVEFHDDLHVLRAQR